MTTRIFWLALLCCIAAAMPAVYAQNKATIPYATLYGAFQTAAAIHGRDVRGAIAVVPRDKSVKPETVTFTVQAKGGAETLQVDPGGEIHDRDARQSLTVRTEFDPNTLNANDKAEISLTLDKSLLAENPTVSLSAKPSKLLPDL